MTIQVACDCGKRFKAPDSFAGRKAKCPGCGGVLLIPRPKAPAALAPQAKPPPAPPRAASRPTHPLPRPAMDGSASRKRALQRFVYLVLLVALIPLGVSTFRGQGGQDDVSERLQRTLEALGESEEDLSEPSSVGELFNRLRDHRIEGAVLAHDSWMHWSFALASSIVFFPVILGIFPRKRAEVPGVLLVGLFSATIGILLLLAVQWIADWTQGRLYMGRSILVVFFYIAKFIGFSYSAALDPENGFIMSCFGFTLGVGLCEEICKAFPLLYRYRAVGELSLKTACLWGLASGAGFGISEGISYSSNYYNGIQGGEIYLVRFSSCVALHAVWSGAAAIAIHRQQHLVTGADSWWELLGNSILLLSVPMLLHGLYDTLLKKDHAGLALFVALLSFGWLAWQIEAAWGLYGEVEEETVRGSKTS